jgi:hypothetical protein
VRLNATTHEQVATQLTDIFGHMDEEDIAALTERLGVELPGAVTASAPSGGSVARMARSGSRPSPSPEARNVGAMGRTVLTAAGGLDGIREGEVLTDRWELAEAMTRTLQRMSRQGPPRGKVLVASATTNYPPERTLGEDAYENARKIDAVGGALTASGGTCLPVNVDYSIPVFATAARPLRDGLPAYATPRGGIRFVPAPDLSEWSGATTVWTEATDANPEGATKPVVSLKCGTEQLIYTNAIPTRLGFGNMQGRFSPEQVAANTDLATAAAARVAENELLKLIAEQSVKDVTSATLIGATRDLLVCVDQVCAAYKSIHRLPDDAMLTAIFPRWVKDLIRSDLAREIGHSQNSDFNSLAVTDALIEDTLRAHNVNPIFHLDGQPESSGKYPSQIFAQQAGEEAIKKYPEKLVWYCFPEGAVQFLDAGRLDLGVVRDSTLDATNDFEVFWESFEGIANRGFTNGILQLVSTLCASGATAGTKSTEGDCA